MPQMKLLIYIYMFVFRFIIQWVFGIVNIVTDIQLNSDMLTYVNSDGVDCNSLNEVFVPSFVYVENNEQYPDPEEFTTFSEYLTLMIARYVANVPDNTFL